MEVSGHIHAVIHVTKFCQNTRADLEVMARRKVVFVSDIQHRANHITD